jgi:hypothetical protein
MTTSQRPNTEVRAYYPALLIAAAALFLAWVVFSPMRERTERDAARLLERQSERTSLQLYDQAETTQFVRTGLYWIGGAAGLVFAVSLVKVFLAPTKT